MSNQPEEHQNQDFTPKPPPNQSDDAQPTQFAQPSQEPSTAQPPSDNQPSANSEGQTPPAQSGTPPLSYDQPEFYQQPEYNTPPPSAPNQPPYGGDQPYNESAVPPPYAAGTPPFGSNPPPPYAQPPFAQPPFAQPPYGYAQVPYAAAPIPPSQPLPLGQAIRQLPAQYWRVLTHPGARTFAFEEGKAAWNIVWVQLIILAIVNVVVSLLLILENNAIGLNTSNASTLGSLAFLTSLSTNALVAGLYALIATFVGFFIAVGIYFLLAKAFRGQGKFLPYGYCYLLIIVPLNVVGGVLRLIPFVGSLIAGALDIYGIVLMVFMTMAVHRLSGGKATLIILIPVIVLFVLAIVLVIILISAIISSVPR